MKTSQLIAAAALAAATSLSHAAATPRFYVEGDLGLGHMSGDCAGADSCGLNGYAWNATAGVVIGAGFSGEVGYTSYGTVHDAYQGLFEHGRTDAWKVGGAYALPVAPGWNADAHLGLAFVKTSYAANFPAVQVREVNHTQQAYFGLGVSHAIDAHLSARAGIDWSKASIFDTDENVRALTVGVRYAF